MLNEMCPVPEISEEKIDCSICLDTLEDNVTVTSCKHKFHETCLSRWMEKKLSCPLCREPFPGSEYRNVAVYEPASRRFEEANVRFLFNHQADIEFVYPYPVATTLEAVWIVRGQGPEWLPHSWILRYSRRRGETIQALEAIRRHNATAEVHMVRGQPPNQLYLCRRCRLAVFSSREIRRIHIQSVHRNGVSDMSLGNHGERD